MPLLEALFGRSQTPQERLRQHLRSLQRAKRELDRERNKLEAQEKTLVADIKKNARQGQIVGSRTYPGGVQGDGSRLGADPPQCTQVLPNEHPASGGGAAHANAAQLAANVRGHAWSNQGTRLG